MRFLKAPGFAVKRAGNGCGRSACVNESAVMNGAAHLHELLLANEPM